MTAAYGVLHVTEVLIKQLILVFFPNAGREPKMGSIGIVINQVEIPTHVEWPVSNAGPKGEDKFLFEVYTGNTIAQFSGGSTVQRQTFSIYLPVYGNTIYTYGDATQSPLPAFNYAALVTPVAMQAHEDEEFICSVDSWDLRMVQQSLSSGKFYCLVLDFALAVANGVVIRVGYNVTVSTLYSLSHLPNDLDPGSAPQ